MAVHAADSKSVSLALTIPWSSRPPAELPACSTTLPGKLTDLSKVYSQNWTPDFSKIPDLFPAPHPPCSLSHTRHHSLLFAQPRYQESMPDFPLSFLLYTHHYLILYIPVPEITHDPYTLLLLIKTRLIPSHHTLVIIPVLQLPDGSSHSSNPLSPQQPEKMRWNNLQFMIHSHFKGICIF